MEVNSSSQQNWKHVRVEYVNVENFQWMSDVYGIKMKQTSADASNIQFFGIVLSVNLQSVHSMFYCSYRFCHFCGNLGLVLL